MDAQNFFELEELVISGTEHIVLLKDKGDEFTSREFTIRAVHKGGRSARPESPINTEDMPLVEFYDRESKCPPYGKLLNWYPFEILLDDANFRRDFGLALHSGLWISGAGISLVIDWLTLIVEGHNDTKYSFSFGESFLESCRKGDLDWVQENINRIKAGKFVIPSIVTLYPPWPARPTMPYPTRFACRKDNYRAHALLEAFIAGHTAVAEFLASEFPVLQPLFLYERFFKAGREGDFDWIRANMESLRRHQLDQSFGFREVFRAGHEKLQEFLLSETPGLAWTHRQESFLLACQKGDITWLQEQGLLEGFDFYQGLENALKHGHDDLFIFLIKKIETIAKNWPDFIHTSIFDLLIIAATNGNLEVLRHLIENAPRSGDPFIDCRDWGAGSWEGFLGNKIENYDDIRDDVKDYLNKIDRIQRQVGIEKGFRQALAVGIDDFYATLKKSEKSASKRKHPPV
ncbi:hypothetical protein EG832_02515 [bacterium]|nr:hypothetical protein [bacterium]